MLGYSIKVNSSWGYNQPCYSDILWKWCITVQPQRHCRCSPGVSVWWKQRHELKYQECLGKTHESPKPMSPEILRLAHQFLTGKTKLTSFAQLWWLQLGVSSCRDSWVCLNIEDLQKLMAYNLVFPVKSATNWDIHRCQTTPEILRSLSNRNMQENWGSGLLDPQKLVDVCVKPSIFGWQMLITLIHTQI
jgi:hypothetical protein